jgi:zinc transporter, ZIP family
MEHWFEPTGFWLALFVCIGAAAATILGGLSVFGSKKPDPRILAFGLAFAGGAMVYVSLVEIFAKSQTAFIEVFGTHNGYAFATLSFFIGVALIVFIDRLIPNPHASLDSVATSSSIASEHDKKYIANVGLLAALAITAHNFPEGMATFFATLDNPSIGAPLAIAIAVHNIPEGVSIAIPVYFATGSRKKALLACTISALAEPVGALLGYAVLAPFLSQTVYGVIFGVIAGVMVFLAIDELLPAARRYSKGHETVYGIVTGMALLALSLVLFKV